MQQQIKYVKSVFYVFFDKNSDRATGVVLIPTEIYPKIDATGEKIITLIFKMTCNLPGFLE